MSYQIGILGYGVSLPVYRLNSKTISTAWGRPFRRGERAIANFDEDSLTLAAAAAASCLADSGSPQIEAVRFASASPPLMQPSCANKLATVLDLPASTRLLDMGGSYDAILRAVSEAQGDTVRLLTGSEVQGPKPGSDEEPLAGDAGCAFLLGKAGKQAIAGVIDSFSLAADASPSLRRQEDAWATFRDVRFGQIGYQKAMKALLQGALAKFKIDPADIRCAAIGSPDAKSGAGVAKKAGFNPEGIITAPQAAIGFTGTADGPLAMITALEQAKPGDKILWASAHDGGIAVLLEALPGIEQFAGKGKMQQQLESGKALDAYARYLSFRQLVAGSGRAEAGFASEIMNVREEQKNVRLHGKKCRQCGRVISLELKVCPGCRAKGDDLKPMKLGRRGTLFTYTAEFYYPCPDPPVGMPVVDLEGGGRLTVQQADIVLGQPEVGEAMELVLRRYHDAGGIPHYYWKARRMWP